ncbi:MAG: ribosomal protein S18-alanine N-acetyltransferase [Thermodesulfobacteriota bacterium]
MGGLFRITPANAADYLTRILEIEALSFFTPWSPVAFCDELRNPASGFWGYADEGRLWGYICCRFAGKDLRVQNIAVHPGRRKRGLGMLLLDKALQAAWAGGLEGVRLEVRTSNLPAQHLYTKRGFREAGRRHKYYRDTGEDAIVMHLAIQDRRRRFNEGFHQPQAKYISISTHSSLEV